VKARLLVLLALLAGAVLVGRPHAEPTSWPMRCPRIPLTIGDWRGSELRIPDEWRVLLETDDLTMRRYQGREGPPVELCVVFSSRNRKLVHPPEVCYSGQGYLISDRETRTLEAARGPREVVALTVSRNNRTERVYALYRCGVDATSSFVVQQLRVMKDAFLGRSLAAAFVRVTTAADAGADQRLQRFLADIGPALEDALR
jgi:EpsI family protein